MPPEDGWGDDPSSEQPTTRRSSIGNFPGAGFPTHGARLLLDGTGTMFRVYAPERELIELVLVRRRTAPPRPGASAWPSSPTASTR